MALNTSIEDFRNIVANGPSGYNDWAHGRAQYFLRIFEVMDSVRSMLSGPSLDVASGNGSLYRGIKHFFPELLPYSIAELKDDKCVIDGDTIPCSIFECDKDRLPFPDRSIGVIFFCDVIEHLIFDPVWTLLEFNRVLKDGGALVLSTPNAAGADRIFNILKGINPINESQYKPCSIYQRHNREWTVNEIKGIFHLMGFGDGVVTTCPHLMKEYESRFLELARSTHLTEMSDLDFGPETIAIGFKRQHLTLDSDLSPDVRWPSWLYSDLEAYRKRPKMLPNLLTDDYS